MELWEHITNWWANKYPSWTYLNIPNERVDHPLPGSIPGPGKGYIRLRLREMRLAHSRIGFKRMHPLVHSFVRMRYGGKLVELPNIAGPGQLQELRTSNLEDLIPLNYKLLPTSPYLGDDVEFLVALFAAEYEDHLDRFLNLLGMVSSLAGRDELALAVRLSSTLKHGLEELFGLNAWDLKLGIRDAVSVDKGNPSPITPGYWLVAAEREDSLPIERFYIDNHRLRIDNGKRTGQPCDFDFFLISLETLTSRDDWDQLPIIDSAYKRLKVTAMKDSTEELNEAYQSLAIKVFESYDLIEDDQFRAVATARSIVERIVTSRKAGLFSITFRGNTSPLASFIEKGLTADIESEGLMQEGRISRVSLLRPLIEGLNS